MFYLIKSKKIGGKRKKGFTLIEIIVAVTIIIILSALAVPKVSGYISKAKEANVISKGKQIYNAAMWTYSEQGNTFDEQKVSDAVTQTTSIEIAKANVTTGDSGKSVEITFANDNKNYILSIKKDTNTYTIDDITTENAIKSVFDSSK